MEGLLPTRAFAAGFAFLAMAGAGGVAGAEPVDCARDARCETLRTFFASQGSPLGASAQVFVEKADQYGLDWRLLPALAMVESGGGRHARRNNIFGWNSGRTRFSSVAAGIDYVASRLAHSPIYRGRTSREILRAYNPTRKQYPLRVIRFMESIASGPVP